MIITAVDVITEIWNQAIALLVRDGWSVSSKYDAFDAEIDFDFLMLKKDGEEIIFGWTNWVEGEIQCDEKHLTFIEAQIGYKFKKGVPDILTPETVMANRK